MFLAYLIAWIVLWKSSLILDVLSVIGHCVGFACECWGLVAHFPNAVPKADPSPLMFILWVIFFVGPMINGLFYLSLFLSYYYKKTGAISSVG